MCNAKKCANTDTHPHKDYCCEKELEECQKLLTNISEPVVRQCEFKDESTLEVYECSWKYETTAINDMWRCGDGHLCNALVDPLGFQCCNSHGGLKHCPKNYPVMCNSTQCTNGTDYCCESDEYYSKSKYKASSRPCKVTTHGNH